MKLFALSIASIGLIALAISQTSFSDSGEEGEHRFWQRTTGVMPIKNELYDKECGSCHFAYPPSLLPQRSWQAIMAGLDDHFGDNAELDSNDHQAISQYLLDNSAEKSGSRHSHKMLKGLSAATTPLRISELPKFKREHNEVPKRVFKNNPDLKSLSQCAACHRDAKQGYFSESRINIPGFGRWDD